MIKRMKNISRSRFNEINFSTTSENPSKDTHVFISVYGSELYEQSAPKINHSIWREGIQIMFDDVEHDFEPMNLKTLSDRQADTIVNFVSRIHNHPEEFEMIIHCYAGISRSAGIGKFINDTFDLNLPNYRSLQLYNSTVYRKLVEAWGRFLEHPVAGT